MRLWDLSGGAAKLEMALKSLQERVADIGEAWNDDQYARFVETYVDPVEQRIKLMITAVHRLAETLSAAERSCRDERDDYLL